MSGKASLVPAERIESAIHVIRDHKVMLDTDLARLYEVETFNLNKAVKRNIERFPEDFMFQLTKEEAAALTFQSGISKAGRGGRRTLPYAFTEQGVDEVDAVGDANHNGVREVFLERSGAPSSTTDQAVLQFGTEIYDALAWTSPEKTPTEAEQSDMARLRTAFRGLTIVKRPDRNSVARVNGGAIALADPTPGLSNDHYLSRPFGRVQMTAFKVAREDAWVEVACLAGPTDISRLVVTDMDDQDAPLSEIPITLARGQKARVIWGKGASETDDVGDANHNGIREIYLDQNVPTKSGDQIVLIHNGRMQDAVVFADWENARFSYPEQDDVKRLVAERLWRAIDPAAPSAVATSGEMCQRVGQAWRRSDG